MCVCRKQNVRLMEDWDWGVVRGEIESRRAGEGEEWNLKTG